MLKFRSHLTIIILQIFWPSTKLEALNWHSLKNAVLVAEAIVLLKRKHVWESMATKISTTYKQHMSQLRVTKGVVEREKLHLERTASVTVHLKGTRGFLSM